MVEWKDRRRGGRTARLEGNERAAAARLEGAGARAWTPYPAGLALGTAVTAVQRAARSERAMVARIVENCEV